MILRPRCTYKEKSFHYRLYLLLDEMVSFRIRVVTLPNTPRYNPTLWDLRVVKPLSYFEDNDSAVKFMAVITNVRVVIICIAWRGTSASDPRYNPTKLRWMLNVVFAMTNDFFSFFPFSSFFLNIHLIRHRFRMINIRASLFVKFIRNLFDLEIINFQRFSKYWRPSLT